MHKMHEMLTNVDMNSQSLLALAARSGSKDVVQRVIDVIEEFKLPEDKVNYYIKRRLFSQDKGHKIKTANTQLCPFYVRWPTSRPRSSPSLRE